MMLGSFIAVIVISYVWYKITVVLAAKVETITGTMAWFLACGILWICALATFLQNIE